MIKNIRLIVCSCFLLAALLGGGCVAPAVSSSVPDFAQAVTLATENSQAAFELVDQRYLETATARFVADYDKVPFNPNQRWHLIDPEDLEIRVELLTALRTYADTLAELAGDGQIAAFDVKAQAIGSSLQAMSGNPLFKKMAGDARNDADLAATAVNALGRWFIEGKRDRALIDAITAMQEPVRQTAELLKADIGAAPDASGRGGHGLRAACWNAYTNALMQQDAYIAQFRDHPDPEARAEAIRKLPALINDRARSDLTLAATADTLDALVAAHQKLLTAIKAKTTFSADAAALVAEGQRLKSYYSALQK